MKELILSNKLLQFKINENVFEVDADTPEIMAIVSEFNDKVQEMAKIADVHEKIKTLCTLTTEYIDKIFGDGASNKIFGKSIRFTHCSQVCSYVFDTFTEYWNETTKALKENA